MRRVVLLLCVGALLVPATPASPDSTVVVRGFNTPDDANYEFVALGCNSWDGYTGAEGLIVRVRRGPDTPPAGERTWGFDLPGPGDALGAGLWVESMNATTVAGLSLHSAGPATGVAYAFYQAPADAETQLWWIGKAALSENAGGWRLVDVASRSYAWTKYNLETNTTVPGSGSGTVAQMTVAQGGDGPGGFMLGFGCNGNEFFMDAWRVGGAGNITTYDLEGGLTVTGISGSAQAITAGQRVVLTGSLTDTGGGLYSGARLVLEAKPYGSNAFTQIAEATTSTEGGDVTKAVRPMKRTVYRWRYPESDAAHGSVSQPFTVNVRTAVAAVPRDRDVKVGDAIVLVGTTSPRKPMETATLWRATANGPDKVGSATIKRDGTFVVRTTPNKTGTWKLYVTVPAASGNLAGRSRTRTIDVTR